MAAPRREPLDNENQDRERNFDPQLALWPSEPAAANPEPEPGAVSGLPAASEIPPPVPAPEPVQDPPWSLADLAAFVIFAAVSLLFSNVATIVAVAVLRRRVAPHLLVEKVLNNTPLVVSMQTGWELLWLGFIYLIVSGKYHRRFWEALKWVRSSYSSANFLFAGALVAFAAQMVNNIFPEQKHLPIEKLFTGPESAYLLAVFGIVVAPFVEELVFRGFFYPVFERLWGTIAAVLVTALLFAGIHIPQLNGGWHEIGSIFVVGVVFSYCRGKTGSLVPPFLMHLSYNTVLFVSLYLTTDRFRNLKG